MRWLAALIGAVIGLGFATALAAQKIITRKPTRAEVRALTSAAKGSCGFSPANNRLSRILVTNDRGGYKHIDLWARAYFVGRPFEHSTKKGPCWLAFAHDARSSAHPRGDWFEYAGGTSPGKVCALIPKSVCKALRL